MAGANRTLHGMWMTPMPIHWIDDEEMNGQTPEGTHCYITQRGHLKMRVEKKQKGERVERVVTLTEEYNNFKIHGKANIKYDRIHFANGVVWIRATDKMAEARQGPSVEEEAYHGAPEDAVEPAPFCGFMCGAKKKLDAPPPEEKKAEEELPPPPAKDIEAGFFGEEDLEGIIDRINDVVGIWGVSEATEREFIKPPVVMMNKMIKSAMETFLDNPIIDLFQYLMDESLDILTKAKAIGQYLHERFVKPLTDALLARLEESYQAIEWMHDRVAKVVAMLAQMVTDELMSRSVEQINDAEVADVQDEKDE